MGRSQVDSICQQIERLGGQWTGHPASLEERFKCELPWRMFSGLFQGTIHYHPNGRVTVLLPGVESVVAADDTNNAETIWTPDPCRWSEFAAQFLLGEIDGIRQFQGDYHTLRDVIDPLAAEVDVMIAAQYYPPQTLEGKDLCVYEMPDTKRRLSYAADGSMFNIYGREILAAA